MAGKWVHRLLIFALVSGKNETVIYIFKNVYALVQFGKHFQKSAFLKKKEKKNKTYISELFFTLLVKRKIHVFCSPFCWLYLPLTFID